MMQLQPLVLDESQPATALVEVVLSPPGRVRSSKGTFIMDARAFAEILRRFTQRGNELPIDYEHQSLPEYNTRPDGKAPAAGWIKAIRFDPLRGLIGMVEWTGQARQEIISKQYRYLSPVIRERRDGRASELHSAAVTNTPAIFGMAALAASRRNPNMTTKKANGSPLLSDELMRVLAEADVADAVAAEVDPLTEAIMGLRAVLVAGGRVEDGAAPEEVIKAALAWVTGMGTSGAPPTEADMSAANDAQAALCERLALKDADWKTIVQKVDETIAKSPSPESYKALADKLRSLEDRDHAREAESAVQAFVDEGRLLPTDAKKMAWARKMALKDAAAFRELMADAPKLYEPGALDYGSNGRPRNEREEVIAQAMKDWKGATAGERKQFSTADILNGELATRGMSLVTKEELTALEVK